MKRILLLQDLVDTLLSESYVISNRICSSLDSSSLQLINCNQNSVYRFDLHRRFPLFIP